MLHVHATPLDFIILLLLSGKYYGSLSDERLRLHYVYVYVYITFTSDVYLRSAI